MEPILITKDIEKFLKMMEKNARVKSFRSASPPKPLPKLEPVDRLDILGEVNRRHDW